MSKVLTADERIEKMDFQLERIAKAIVTGFDNSSKELVATKHELKGQIDIYARAVDAYATQAETYMQEMLALGAKVDRLQIKPT